MIDLAPGCMAMLPIGSRRTVVAGRPATTCAPGHVTAQPWSAENCSDLCCAAISRKTIATVASSCGLRACRAGAADDQRHSAARAPRAQHKLQVAHPPWLAGAAIAARAQVIRAGVDRAHVTSDEMRFALPRPRSNAACRYPVAKLAGCPPAPATGSLPGRWLDSNCCPAVISVVPPCWAPTAAHDTSGGPGACRASGRCARPLRSIRPAPSGGFGWLTRSEDRQTVGVFHSHTSSSGAC